MNSIDKKACGLGFVAAVAAAAIPFLMQAAATAVPLAGAIA